MKTDFVIALTQLAAERNLTKEVIIRTLEVALVPVFKKTSFAPDQDVSVKIMPQTGEVKVYAWKVVVRRTTDPRQELTLAQARKLKADAQVGDLIEVEYTPADAGRIAAQTAKQVILQRLREAERDAVYGEYADKEGDIVSGVVHVIEPKQTIVDIGRAEAILPLPEQVSTEHYRVGQRLKLYLTKVARTPRGTQLIVSRTHQNLLRRLFELEVPEIHSGIVELKALAREPGYRSKVAVTARQEGVDAVGCCLGLRSIRIQNIIKELNGEKIDVIQWHSDPAVFIASALSPASVVKVEMDEEGKRGNVIVPDRQLSLAIGKGGQNARLAARLTGWRIDIRSVSMVEAAKVALKPPEVAEVVGAEGRIEESAREAVEVVSAAEAVVEAVLQQPVAEEAAEVVGVKAPEVTEEVAPARAEAPVEAKAPVETKAPVEAKAPARVEEPEKTYSVEEILSEIEAATERIQRRFGGVTSVPKLETKVKKGKKLGVPQDELPTAKPKPKKAIKRQRVADEDFDVDEELDKGLDFGKEADEDLQQRSAEAP